MNLVGVEFSSKLAFEIETTSLEINFKPSLVSLYFGRFIFGHEDDNGSVVDSGGTAVIKIWEKAAMYNRALTDHTSCDL